MTSSLDLGCGNVPRNPYGATELIGIDIVPDPHKKIYGFDLVVEPIQFPDESFDFVTAFDFIEHVPRTLYMPQRKHPFIDLMSEIYRVLKVGGKFHSSTPAFPRGEAWQDPTHVNIITEATFPIYFCNPCNYAQRYGFKGVFEMENQYWNDAHLVSILKKVKHAE